jgi:hypothetical protein
LEELSPSLSVKTYNDTLKNVANQIRSEDTPDSVIYVNVLEHIADDLDELQIINRTLDAGGRLFAFVPALRWLHGSYDRQINHFRRYTRSELERKCITAGFKVITSRYFDLIGVLPWWVKYKLLQSNNMEQGAVRFYDQRIVPIAKTLESTLTPRLGKNVLLIAEKI